MAAEKMTGKVIEKAVKNMIYSLGLAVLMEGDISVKEDIGKLADELDDLYVFQRVLEIGMWTYCHNSLAVVRAGDLSKKKELNRIAQKYDFDINGLNEALIEGAPIWYETLLMWIGDGVLRHEIEAYHLAKTYDLSLNRLYEAVKKGKDVLRKEKEAFEEEGVV